MYLCHYLFICYHLQKYCNIELWDCITDYKFWEEVAFALFQYTDCGLKEIGEKPGNLSIRCYGDLQNMKCLLADCYTTC